MKQFKYYLMAAFVAAATEANQNELSFSNISLYKFGS